ncbi:MAG: hypothetical protein E6J14_11630 [Chloroflexi bacterium]|nr:MAG: hypothetical protein E6J14_11630 [Chloroflexota bacterium]
MPQVPVRPHRRGEDWRARRLTSADGAGLSATWSSAVEAFLRDARARNCSVATIENYRTYLLGPRAQQFIADYDVHNVNEVSPRALRDFQAELLDAGLAAGTVATFHRVMRNFLGFCKREGWGVPGEALEISAPRLPVTEPATLSEADERRVLAAAGTERDCFLIEFMLRTGVRLGEVCNVVLDDLVDGSDGQYLRVRQGKGRKDRIVPLDTTTTTFSKRIAAYIRNVRPRETRCRHLFLSTRHNLRTNDLEPMSPTAVKLVMKRLSEKTGIHVHPHKLRHTFATRALAGGVDSLVLQRALGHTTLAMVNRYVHFQARDMLDAWRARRD